MKGMGWGKLRGGAGLQEPWRGESWRAVWSWQPRNEVEEGRRSGDDRSVWWFNHGGAMGLEPIRWWDCMAGSHVVAASCRIASHRWRPAEVVRELRVGWLHGMDKAFTVRLIRKRTISSLNFDESYLSKPRR